MAEITLSDLIAWEPRLHVVPPSEYYGMPASEPIPALERELTWAVTVRASAPVLPILRGGELVIVPRRVVTDGEVMIQDLVREVAARGAVGLVFDQAPDLNSALPILMIEVVSPDFESDVNRLLTERRGEIYRAGTDLGRILTQANAIGSDLEEVLAATAAYLELPAAVVDGRGNAIAATDETALPPAGGRLTPADANGRTTSGDLMGFRLSGGEMLWLGPVSVERRALARVTGERVAVAAEAALSRAADVRPRGAARAAALAGLLSAAGADSARAAAALGLPANGRYAVALAAPDTDPVALLRVLAVDGVVHDAGMLDDAMATVIELRPARTRPTTNGGRRGPSTWATTARGEASPGDWLAVSGAVSGTTALPEAARQARFVAALLETGQLPGPAARFDRLNQLGVFRLLYPLWGSEELAAFARDALGDLAVRDKRGSLRRTLLAYLESGGSQVEAAAALNIHRNTLAYRLKQISALTATESMNPSSHLVLHLALVASEMPAPPDR